MADRVNSPLLTVTPTESAGVKAAKIGNSSSKSSESREFSRVLDDQRSTETQAEKRTDAQSGADRSAGKALPPEGKDAAETADAAATSAEGKGSPADKPTAQAENAVAGSEEGAKARSNAELPTASRDTAGVPSEFSASLSSLSPGVSPAALSASATTQTTLSAAAGELPLAGLGDAQTPGSVALDAVAPVKTADAANVDGIATSNVQPAGASKGSEVLTASGASAPGVTPWSPGSPEVVSAARASEALADAETLNTRRSTNPGSPAVALAANASAVTGSAAVPQDKAAFSTAGFSASSLTGLDAADANRNSSFGDALAKDGQRAVPGQTSGATAVADALNRSTVDWLRSGMGSENAGQRSVAEMQLATSSEVSGGVVSAPRGDGALPSGATAAATVLSPTTGSAASSPASAATTAVPEYSLMRAPDDGEFPGELTARMKTLVRDGVREARLQLHPAELGRLQVTVTTEGDQTKVAFTAETPAARDAIEQSLPRLREMLEQSGLQLAQSDVGQGDLSGGDESRESSERGEGNPLADDAAVADGADSDGATRLVYEAGNARIDTYI